MKETAETRETERDKPTSEMAEQAMKNYEQILRAGFKFQEEATRCWTNLLSQSAAVPPFLKPINTVTTATSAILPEAQKRVQEVFELMEKNSRTGVELMKKAVDAVQTPVVA